MTDMEKLGKRLKAIRVQKGHTLASAGDAVGISRHTLSKYESNIGIVPIQTFFMLLNVYEVSLDYVVGDLDVINN